MCSIQKLKIDFKALPEGETTISADFGSDFFEAIEDSEITQGDVHVDVSIRKTIHFSEVMIHTTATIVVECDRCLDPMDLPIEAEQRLTVKTGSEYSEEDDLIILDEEDEILDLTWFVYESILLHIPVKHVHAPGKCNRAMIELLNQHSATRSDDEDAEEKPVDPRWSKLAGLKLDN